MADSKVDVGSMTKAQLVAAIQQMQADLDAAKRSGRKGPASGPCYGFSFASWVRAMGYRGYNVGQVAHVAASQGWTGSGYSQATINTQRQLGAAIGGPAKNQADPASLAPLTDADWTDVDARLTDYNGKGDGKRVRDLQAQLDALRAQLAQASS